MLSQLSIRALWERKGPGGKLLWLALLPLSKLYSAAVQIRNFLFAQGVLRSIRLPRPVVSVGNLTVGGTGKTPTCLWLSRELARHGLKVGILSRGYRRKETRPVVLQLTDDSPLSLDLCGELEKAGDEPLMMAGIYRQTVGVGANRAAAAAELLRRQDVDVFLLDDGFQHRRIKRDVDVLLLGQDSSGYVLPAGPFREPRQNLRRADFLLATGGNGDWASVISQEAAANSFNGSLQPVCLIGFSNQGSREFPLTLLYRSKILTVTGIADPRGLYRLIHEWEGEIVETLEFPDHYSYTSRDWQQISRMARLVDLIITTEKDILKLARFPFAKDKLLALRVAMEVANGDALVAAIVAKIESARRPVG
ncbi:MAG TPA: tetraacyldisaccharide 4'-kinase [Candidatus Limnocylindrales bacterium]|nr:tetraacyldisaccharide 4'-kinase [Candidatus Limnocylindrales bacterium]